MKSLQIIMVNFLFLMLIPTNRIYSQITFKEITKEAGIRHIHVAPGLMGGGVAVFDFNNDGLDDFYFTGGNYEDRLFRNLGDGTFEMISENSAIYDTRVIKTMGVTTGDIDNDGFKEIFVNTERDEPDILFYNNGDGTFTNISEQAGIRDKAWSMGAVFTDINLDGWNDIYVVNYIQNPESIIDDQTGDIIGFSHTCFRNFLYINQGDKTFVESAAAYGLDDDGCGLAVTTSDFDNDGMADLYIANDFGEWVIPNRVFKNEHPNTTFTDITEDYNLADEVYGMSIATGDFNRDGELDYYISNIGRNVLHRNMGNQTFRDTTDHAGVSCSTVDGLNSTSWGSAFIDVDNDGYEDLFVANGYISAAKFIETSKTDPDKLFYNNRDETFSDISISANIGYEDISRGMGYTDFDLDGDLDIVISVTQRVLYTPENVKLYENQLENDNHWIKLKLVGVLANRDGYGAQVHAFASGEIFIRELSSSGTHASQHTSLIHIGLGNFNSLDSLLITWPGGRLQRFYDIQDIDQILQITEGDENYKILGCSDPLASNFDPESEIEFGCFYGQQVTGVNEKISRSIRVYPNPVRDYLFIDNIHSNIKFQLMNTEGKTLRTGTLKNTIQNTIRLTELEKGLYILDLSDHSGLQTKFKIIKY